MQMWASIASGNHWELQRHQRTEERQKAMLAAGRAEPVVAAPTTEVTIAEAADEDGDPNDMAPMPQPVREVRPPPRDPYDHSSDDELYEDL